MRNAPNATVEKIEWITERLFFLSVKPHQALKPFIAGQYIALGVLDGDKLIRKSYSIASGPDQIDRLDFLIALVEEGELTPKLARFKGGEELLCGPKIVGRFTLQKVPEQSRLILVSTGTGIAPYLSMLEQKQIFSDYSEIVLIHGVRFEEELLWREILEKKSATQANFHYYPTVSRPKGEWSGAKGYVQELVFSLDPKLDANTDHIFLCGNPAMIEDLSERLKPLGFVAPSKGVVGNLHIESYW